MTKAQAQEKNNTITQLEFDTREEVLAHEKQAKFEWYCRKWQDEATGKWFIQYR